jgi:hypothetical protein
VKDKIQKQDFRNKMANKEEKAKEKGNNERGVDRRT